LFAYRIEVSALFLDIFIDPFVERRELFVVVVAVVIFSQSREDHKQNLKH